MEMDGKLEIKRLTPEIERARDEGMANIAERRPRDLEIVETNALTEIKLLGVDAKVMFYIVPRAGKEILGLSIRAADMLLRHYGNCQAAARIEDETEDFVDVMGVFHDLETNTKRLKSLRVSKWFRRRDSGKLERMSIDMETNAVNAGASKAVRNAILDGIPIGLKNKVFEAVRMASVPPASLKDKDKPHPKALEQIRADLAGAKITEDMLKAKWGKGLDEMNRTELTRVRGLLTALEDGYVSVKEAFKPNGAETAEEPQAVEAATALGATAEELPERKEAERFVEQVAGPETAPSPPLAVAPKPEPPVEKPKPPEDPEVSIVHDMLATLDEISTAEEYNAWPDKHSKVIIRLSRNGREGLLENWEKLGKKKGFTRGRGGKR